jgi:hypothetical protein
MPKINKIEIDGEKIYIAKSNLFGWGIVHPNKNDDGSINWFNTLTGGSYIKLISSIIIILIISGFLYEYSSNLKYCAEIMSKINMQFNLSNFNMTEFNNNLNLSPSLYKARNSLIVNTEDINTSIVSRG